MRRRRLALAGGLAGLAGTAYALEKAAVVRWRADPEAVVAAGRALPGDVRHHFVGTDDGGRLHVVERGAGAPVVLVHGVTLGVGIWVAQLQGLAETNRVIAVGQRGHGQSLAGEEGYSIERLAEDLLIVLQALEVREAVLVGHSMGGMVVQRLAVDRADELGEHVGGLVLVATTAGGFVPGGRLGGALALATAGLGSQLLAQAERRGRGLLPQRDLGAWGTRVNFGASPRAVDVELARSMVAAMSPSAMQGLLGPLLRFDSRAELSAVRPPTRVVVGTRDVLTPPRMARELARGIAGAELVVYPGCGHLVMLEREAELNDLLRRCSAEVASGASR